MAISLVPLVMYYVVTTLSQIDEPVVAFVVFLSIDQNMLCILYRKKTCSSLFRQSFYSLPPFLFFKVKTCFSTIKEFLKLMIRGDYSSLDRVGDKFILVLLTLHFSMNLI